MSENSNIHASEVCMTDQDIHVHRNNIQKQLNLRVGAESKGGTWSDVACHSNRPYFDCDVFTLFFLVSDKANLNAWTVYSNMAGSVSIFTVFKRFLQDEKQRNKQKGKNDKNDNKQIKQLFVVFVILVVRFANECNYNYARRDMKQWGVGLRFVFLIDPYTITMRFLILIYTSSFFFYFITPYFKNARFGFILAKSAARVFCFAASLSCYTNSKQRFFEWVDAI